MPASKEKRLELWQQLKNKVAPSAPEWSAAEEAKLTALKAKIDSNIDLDDTQFGRDKEVAINAAKATLLSAGYNVTNSATMAPLEDETEETEAMDTSDNSN